MWHNGEIIKIKEEAPNVRRLWMRVDSESVFDFKPGQFVTMDLPISEKRLQRWRSYSIANAPDGTGVLEFIVSRSESGLGTKFLFETAVEGTEIRFKGPDGAFCLPGLIDLDLVFICTGTGVAPFRSMIQFIVNQQVAHRSIHLIFGTRTPATILYREEFEQLKQTLPGFRYDIALSRAMTDFAVQGYVHQLYLKEYSEVQPNRRFYICGWSNMVDDVVANLMVTCGYDRKQIYYELYG